MTKWLAIFILGTCFSAALCREFLIDYDNDQFLLDGEPFRYVSGSVHYFRIPSVYWEDRLKKVRAAGLNAVTTYVEWSQHELEPGTYDFSGDLDLERYVTLASEAGLLVILRVGPYICGEREMGGFPPWLLSVNPDMKLRTNDSSYMFYVNRWLDVLMERMKPLLYGNGGPIIMVQVENEYGSYYACDSAYTESLRDIFASHVGNAAVLFTTDGGAEYFLKCGKIPDVYATVDFGPGSDVNNSFSAMRAYEPRGPLVNNEFYPGWLDHWEESHSKSSTESVVKTLREMLDAGASVNFYMFHGGTNFGFTAGANFGSTYTPDPTSYDYDAPLTEAGDPTEKYFAIRDVVKEYLPLLDVETPEVQPKASYGTVQLKPAGSVFDSLAHLAGEPVTSELAQTFEQLQQSYGFVLYETTISRQLTDPALLNISDIRDRGYVYVDQEFVGILSRTRKIYTLPFFATQGQKLQILLENQGRINYGSMINDFKGLLPDVRINDQVQTNWTMYTLPLSDVNLVQDYAKQSSAQAPEENNGFVGARFYYGSFTLPENATTLQDTFLRLDGWYKGVAFLNGHNLGRYWPVAGPQMTLYVPANYLQANSSENELVLLELERSPCFQNGDCTAAFVEEHQIDGPTGK